MHITLFEKDPVKRKLHKIERIIKRNQKKGMHHLYLFLDFDGVINIFYKEGTKEYEELLKREQDEFDFADRNCIRQLNQLVHNYPIDVVISSSWRYSGKEACVQYLEHAGFQEGEKVIGCTGTDWGISREELILRYLEEHPNMSGFLILDDLDMPVLNSYLIQTDVYEGFNEEKYQFAEDIMRKYLDIIPGYEYNN